MAWSNQSPKYSYSDDDVDSYALAAFGHSIAAFGHSIAASGRPLAFFRSAPQRVLSFLPVGRFPDLTGSPHPNHQSQVRNQTWLFPYLSLSHSLFHSFIFEIVLYPVLHRPTLEKLHLSRSRTTRTLISPCLIEDYDLPWSKPEIKCKSSLLFEILHKSSFLF